MTKHVHEFRDPIHGFIRVDSKERLVVDSRPVQRLRHIHQLALTYLLYPGATHRRFEHSLGVMELAGRVYDTVTDPNNILHDAVRDLVPEHNKMDHQYWRRVVRMAALCHDVGHLPFSHAAEDLLPKGYNHELLTIDLVESTEMKPIWSELAIHADHVAKIAVGPRKYRKSAFTSWETILSEIIIGDAFGVDRIDYLLRDSHHVGVGYGKFDHTRLLDNLRILPKTYTDGGELSLGVELGGMHASEALLLARYFMYTQVYYHAIRRAYDYHLMTFLRSWLENKMFSTNPEEHLAMNDNDVMANIFHASRTPSHAAHVSARMIVNREHFRLLYQRNPEDVAVNQQAGKLIADSATGQFGENSVRYYTKREADRSIDYPVWSTDRRIASSLAHSDILNQVPILAVEYVFIAPEKRKEAEHWLAENRKTIIAPKKEEKT
jgi:HD superfamily phosphohydrolase